MHIFAENVLIRNHNDAMIQKFYWWIDHLPKCIFLSEEERVSLRATKTTGTGNLSSQLELKIGARVRLINNIDISDTLINGQIGVIKYTKSVAGKLTKIYVSFDDNPAELSAMSHDDLSGRHQ